MKKLEKGIHWLAVAFIVILGTLAGAMLLVAIFFLCKNIWENWVTWLKACGVVLFLALSQWAPRYITDHGWPWNRKETT